MSRFSELHHVTDACLRYSIATPSVSARCTPCNSTVKVEASYYGMVVINEAIGSCPSTKISEIATNTNKIGGFAVYVKEQLARVVLLNYEPHLPGHYARRTLDVVIKGIYSANWPGPVRVKRFRTPYTNSVAGL